MRRCKRYAIDGNVLAEHGAVVDEMLDAGIAMLLLAHGIMHRAVSPRDPARHWFVLWRSKPAPVLYARAECAFLIAA